jgi:hypothetical protein
MLKWFIIGAALLVGYCALPRLDPFDACVERGKKYFREIGSWPYTSDNRDAARVVEERCKRTNGAF